MNEIEAITKDLLGSPLSSLRRGAALEAAIEQCCVDLKNANSFERLLRIIPKENILIDNLEFVYALLKLGRKFTGASLVGNDFWWMLMVR